jgi:hypothetical protein
MTFSDSATNLGIVEQSRSLTRLDSNQLTTAKIVASCNNYLDTVAGYAIGADRRFQWDDTNHTKMPIGTTNLVADQRLYSFLTDEQSNRILTLTRIDVLNSAGLWRQLIPIDQAQISPMALDEYDKTSGIPQFYDKTNDNVIKLYPASDTSITSGLKFYFQRSPSYFTASDTTKEPGVASTLHRGFVIAAAYDGALTFGLPNLQPLSVEFQKEEQKMKEYFASRNADEGNKYIGNVMRNSR